MTTLSVSVRVLIVSSGGFLLPGRLRRHLRPRGSVRPVHPPPAAPPRSPTLLRRHRPKSQWHLSPSKPRRRRPARQLNRPRLPPPTHRLPPPARSPVARRQRP